MSLKGCGRKIGDFSCCTVVCGDCLELMPTIPKGSVDAVITDPPYGLEWKSTGFQQDFKTDWQAAKEWDKKVSDDAMRRIVGVAANWVVWGGNYYASALGNCKAPLVWDKQTGENNFADGEIAFTSFQNGTLRIFRHQWCGAFKDSERGQRNLHPTQKPVELMAWCLNQIWPLDTVLDPFLGSGTTAVAAKKLGRHFLGFEISPVYAELARKRIALVEMQPTLFERKPEQLGLTQGAEGLREVSDVHSCGKDGTLLEDYSERELPSSVKNSESGERDELR